MPSATASNCQQSQPALLNSKQPYPAVAIDSTSIHPFTVTITHHFPKIPSNLESNTLILPFSSPKASQPENQRK